MPSVVQEVAFFSYSREDSEFALRVAKDLKDAGAAVWIDQLDIEPGQDWDVAVEAAVTRCPRMLLILSPVSVQSRNVRNEIVFALDEKKTIIPVLYQDCVVPLQLRRVQHIDFRTDYQHGLKALLKAVGVGPAMVASAAAPATASEVHPAPTDTGVRRLVAEQVEAEVQRRLAAERARLEEERKQATEQARLQEETRQGAAEKARLEEREERERQTAAEKARLEEERKQAAQRARLEEERRQASEQASLELEEEKRQAAAKARVEQEERELLAAEGVRFEEERQQAAQQAQLEEECKRAAAEKARLEQEERERMGTVVPARFFEPKAELRPSSPLSFLFPASIWGRALVIGLAWAVWTFAITQIRFLGVAANFSCASAGSGLSLGIFLKKIMPSFRWPHVAGMMLSWGLAALPGCYVAWRILGSFALSSFRMQIIPAVVGGTVFQGGEVPPEPPFTMHIVAGVLVGVVVGVVFGGVTALIVRRAKTGLTVNQALVIAAGYILAAVVSLVLLFAGDPIKYLLWDPLWRAQSALAFGFIGSGIMFWQLSKVEVIEP